MFYKAVGPIANGKYIGPAPGRHWLVLGGIINHGNGTTTRVTFNRNCGGAIGTGETLLCTDIRSAMANGFYPLFNCGSDVAGVAPPADQLSYHESAQYSPMILDDQCQIYLSTGDAAAFVQVWVLEW